MTDHYQRIGRAALSACPVQPKKLLLYSEIEDGVSSADLFYLQPGGRSVRFRFAPAALRDLLVDFWEVGDSEVRPRSWAALSFVVEDNRFSVNLVYPEQMVPEEDLSDRRPRVVEACFPGVQVDYSHPNA